MAAPAYSHPDTKPIATSLGFGIQTRSLRDLFDYFHLYKQDHSLEGEIPQQLAAVCYVCQSEQVFSVTSHDGEVNWRETLCCPVCELINRWRSSIHLFEALCTPTRSSSIYLTEAITPLYRLIRQRYPKTVGSEFVAGIKSGKFVKAKGVSIRVEDVTQLSFPEQKFDAVLSFDVLEHVPDYQQALREFFRVLKPGGVLLWSAPFCFAEQTEIRASLAADGSVQHHMPPDYHGDPLSDEGVLCFQSFGMDILQAMESLGFEQASVCCYSSLEFAYLGRNIAFLARKPNRVKVKRQWLSSLFSANSPKSL